MRKFYYPIFGLLFFATFIRVDAQDIHFSQFYMSPLNLNPALTGVMNCNTRAIVNYRNQWAAVLGANAYNTFSASYDKKIPVGREDYFGIGGSLWGDVAGESKFGTVQGRLSLSFSKKMGGYRHSAHYLVFGADAAFSQRRIKPGDLRWPTQITSTGFDPNIPSNEIINDFNFLYPDIGAGVLWFSVLNQNTNWYIGVAAAHLNTPNVSFLGDGTANLYMRTTVHGGAQLPIASKVQILPNAVFLMQGEHREINAGASLRFLMGTSAISDQSWQFGGWYRLGNSFDGGLISDALILSTRFHQGQFGIGFSYDLNISELRAGGAGNGAFELSLSYEICGPENRGVYCPRF